MSIFILLPLCIAAPLEEVVVTARKRTERLQDVPMSVSVRTGNELEARNAFRMQEIIEPIPNVAVDIQQPRQASISIRGLGKNPGNDGLEASVGVFLDGVFLGRPGMFVTDLTDIERFEVLRGPQGTLFGKNTTAGAINITTRAPADELEGWIEASTGNQDLVQWKGAIAAPIVRGTLAFRLSAFDTSRRGFVNAATLGKDLGESDRHGARGQLLWSPGDSATVRLIADYSSQDEDAPGYMLVEPAIYLDDGSIRPNNFLDRAARAGYAPAIDPFARRSDVDGVQRMSGEQAGFSVQAVVPAGRHTLTSISAWRKWTFRPQNDGDGTALSVLPELGATADDRQFTQELRIASPPGRRIDYVVGAYYFSQHFDSHANTLYGPAAADFLQVGLPEGALDGFRVETRADPETASYAVFTQGSWRPTDVTEITAGVRWTEETRSASIVRTNSGGAVLSSQDAAARAARDRLGQSTSRDVETAEDFLSAMLSASLRVAENMMTYVCVSHGAKSGGINVAIAPVGVDQVIEPEVATSYELGLKSQWFAQRLQLNAATFWTDVDQFQATGRDPLRGANYLTNAGSVRSRGIEVDGVYQVHSDLKFTLAAGWNDATYTSFESAPCPVETVNPVTCDLTGMGVVGVPPWTAHAGVEYEFPVGSSAHRGDVRAEYFRSAGYFGESSKYTRVEGYGAAHLRLGVRTPDDRWQVWLWSRNVFDADYFTSVFSGGAFATGAVFGVTGDPRTYGLSLRFNFP